MPQLDNTRWEMFCIGLVSGKSKTQAYADAGFNPSTANASQLGKRPEILARVAELMEERTQFKATFVDNSSLEHLAAVDKAAQEGNVTREWVITELMDLVKEAKAAQQYSAAKSAIELLGKEIGMFQEKGKKPEDPGKTPENAPLPVSVDAINRLLEASGYQGPPIDLTQKKKKEVAVIRSPQSDDHSA